jgi:hypothetical protein
MATPTMDDMPTGTFTEFPTPTNNHDAECAVSGCSGQLCVLANNTSTEDKMDTCQWKESYACFSASAVGWDKGNGTILWDSSVGDAVDSTDSKPMGPMLFDQVPLAYCGYNPDSQRCAWLPNPDLDSCVASYSAPSPPVLPTPPDSNYTCFIQGCFREICMPVWPGEPVAMYDCRPSTPELENAMNWTSCLVKSDCEKTTGYVSPPNAGNGTSPSEGTKEAVAVYGCDWNPDARPGLRECLEKSNWPGSVNVTVIPATVEDSNATTTPTAAAGPNNTDKAAVSGTVQAGISSATANRVSRARGISGPGVVNVWLVGVILGLVVGLV